MDDVHPRRSVWDIKDCFLAVHLSELCKQRDGNVVRKQSFVGMKFHVLGALGLTACICNIAAVASNRWLAEWPYRLEGRVDVGASVGLFSVTLDDSGQSYSSEECVFVCVQSLLRSQFADTKKSSSLSKSVLVRHCAMALGTSHRSPWQRATAGVTSAARGLW